MNHTLLYAGERDGMFALIESSGQTAKLKPPTFPDGTPVPSVDLAQFEKVAAARDAAEAERAKLDAAEDARAKTESKNRKNELRKALLGLGLTADQANQLVD